MMVTPHRPTRPERIVVKGQRSTPRQHARRACVVCGASLRGDHTDGDLVCDSHPVDGCEPRHIPTLLLDSRIVGLLYAADGQTLNLCRALGIYPSRNNHKAIQDAVARINRTRRVRIAGVRGWGYRLVVAVERSGRG